jgi:hypothetical protein
MTECYKKRLFTQLLLFPFVFENPFCPLAGYVLRNDLLYLEFFGAPRSGGA